MAMSTRQPLADKGLFEVVSYVPESTLPTSSFRNRELFIPLFSNPVGSLDLRSQVPERGQELPDEQSCAVKTRAI
jgi:hypothetical protein